MINSFCKFLVFLFVGLSLSIANQEARAQECEVSYENITKLRKPEYGSYNIWDTVYGEVDSQEEFISAAVNNDSIMVVGTRMDETAENKELVLSVITRRGRVALDEFHQIKGLEDVVKILPYQDGYVVLGTLRNASKQNVTWLGFFDQQAVLTGEVTLSENKASLIAGDMFVKEGGENIMLVTSLKASAGSDLLSSRIYELDGKGKVLKHRTYSSGSESRIYAFFPYKDGYVTAGYSVGSDGRKNGWIMRLENNLNINWQRLYPRGSGATLYVGTPTIQGLIAVGGTSSPAVNEGTRAGWLMVVDASDGQVGWQRYYTEDVHFSIKGLHAEDNGALSVMMDGEAMNEDRQSHVRLMNINPRGVIYGAETYYNGEGVNAASMVMNTNNERLLIGRTIIAHQIEYSGDDQASSVEPAADKAKDEVRIVKSQEGWVLAAMRIEPFEDPCRSKYTPLP